MTVIETPGFLRDAAAELTDEERTEVISFLAANPEVGDIMPETGGGRKLRWGGTGPGQARRRAGHLLLPQRVAAAVSAQRIREE